MIMPRAPKIEPVSLIPVPQFPHVQSGDDLAGLLVDRLLQANLSLQEGDVVAVAQKVVSKAEGRFVSLASVQPSSRAQEVAAITEKDPRLVELILQESQEISRMRAGVLITRHRLGFTSANAGIDRSNVMAPAGEETVLLLPEDPDASAARLRQRLEATFGVRVAVIINDSHGRPFRLGTVGVAIGVAGLPALWDRRGEPDLYGYRLQHTEVALADEMAAAASLIMGQGAEGTPVVLLRGLTLPSGEGSGRQLVRPANLDLYR